MSNDLATSWLTHALFLPDHWLRRVDLGVALLSTGMTILTVMGHWHNGGVLWMTTAMMGWTLWATNGTARLMKGFRTRLPDLMLWMLLRFGR